MLDVVGYVRLSEEDSSKKDESPINQKKIISEVAKRNEHNLIRFYEDINKTGSNIFRQGLKDLMVDAELGKFFKVYIKDWSRLSRSIIDQETIFKELSKMNIRIISCDGVEDKKARQVVGLSNEWLIDDVRKKTRDTHDLKIKENISLNRPPFGYYIKKELVDGKIFIPFKKFLINEKEAEIVREIFKLKLAGISEVKIAKKFKISQPKVNRILKNITYMGYNEYIRKKDIDGNLLKHPEVIIYKGLHEPIILDKKLFKKLNPKMELPDDHKK